MKQWLCACCAVLILSSTPQTSKAVSTFLLILSLLCAEFLLFEKPSTVPISAWCCRLIFIERRCQNVFWFELSIKHHTPETCFECFAGAASYLFTLSVYKRKFQIIFYDCLVSPATRQRHNLNLTSQLFYADLAVNSGVQNGYLVPVASIFKFLAGIAMFAEPCINNQWNRTKRVTKRTAACRCTWLRQLALALFGPIIIIIANVHSSATSINEKNGGMCQWTDRTGT